MNNKIFDRMGRKCKRTGTDICSMASADSYNYKGRTIIQEKFVKLNANQELFHIPRAYAKS